MQEYATFHIYTQYTLASPRREEIVEAFKARQIGFCVYYPVPFHLQECFASLGYAETAFPISTKASREVFSIPVYPELTDDEQQQVIETIRSVLT